MEWDEQSLTEPRHPLCRQALPLVSQAFSRHVLTRYLSPITPDRWEGYLLSTTRSVLAYNARRHGCGRWESNPRPSPYEGDELPLLYAAKLLFSHFGIIIIPQFCLFVKIREYVEKEGGSLMVYQPLVGVTGIEPT